jgi:uncharacterized membrane protein YhaH (DUF805 family)
MHATQAFFLGLGVSAALAFAVVWYIRPHLRAILVDLCGTEIRADFWMAFTNVTLILVPMVFAMEFFPETEQGSQVASQLIAQLKWALIGLIAAVAGLGMVLRSFIFTGLQQKAPKF